MENNTIPIEYRPQAEAFVRLLQIMDRLRAECPWDKKQTFDSLSHLTIEETYELTDAIHRKDFQGIEGELGDLILHIVFYAKIGSEQHLFDVTSLILRLCEKLIRRHPHIYGEVKADSAEAVTQNWEQIKLKEGAKSVLGGVPSGLPALIKAFRIQEKAASVGFDWDNAEAVRQKIDEELAELTTEIEAGNVVGQTAEIGDLLFAVINYARKLGINPEQALQLTNTKFINRFRFIESTANAQGKSLSTMTLAEMDELWNAAKLKLTQVHDAS